MRCAGPRARLCGGARRGRARARVLLVGDCLYLDIVTFAQPALAAEGITLEPDLPHVEESDPAPARDRRARSDAVLAVFYSPFTYEFVPTLEPLHHLRAAVRRRGARPPWRRGVRPGGADAGAPRRNASSAPSSSTTRRRWRAPTARRAAPCGGSSRARPPAARARAQPACRRGRRGSEPRDLRAPPSPRRDLLDARPRRGVARSLPARRGVPASGGARPPAGGALRRRHRGRPRAGEEEARGVRPRQHALGRGDRRRRGAHHVDRQRALSR